MIKHYYFFFSGIWNDANMQNIILREIGDEESVSIGTLILFIFFF